LDQLVDADYEILIEIEEGEPELMVGRGNLEGSSDIKFAFYAHLDHPGLANDDLSGVMLVCETLRRLR
jgi:aminopeptidase-like protein